MTATTLAAASLGSAQQMRTTDPSSADYNITTNSPDGTKPCRWIIVAASGTIVATGTDGQDVTLPTMPTGHRHDGEFTGLKDTSTCTSVIIAW